MGDPDWLEIEWDMSKSNSFIFEGFNLLKL